MMNESAQSSMESNLNDENVECPNGRNNLSLGASIREAQILLAYASQHGIVIDESIIRVIVSSGTLFSKKAMSDEDEAVFWIAFNTIAMTVSPVSVDSLQSIMEPDEPETRAIFGVKYQRRPLARRAVRWYTILAILAMIVLLIVQVYWLFGTQITSDIQKISDKELEAHSKWEAAAFKAPGANLKADSADGAVVTKVQDSSMIALKVQKENYAMHKSSSYESLFVWSRIWSVFLPERHFELDNPALQKENDYAILLRSSNLLLDVIQRYLLPLLYGFLGTCVYVLRTLSSEISARTYSESSNIGFRIRLYLGTLGGMVIAWFVIPENNDGIFKTLSPFALAFLAGYSVEILFAAMDRFLIAFTSKNT